MILEIERSKPVSDRKAARVTNEIEATLVVFCSILYFAVAFNVAGAKLLWYDELVTLKVIESGTFRKNLETQREGLDLQPVAFFCGHPAHTVARRRRNFSAPAGNFRVRALSLPHPAEVASIWVCQRHYDHPMARLF